MKVAIGLSGGVDSSVSAHLLQEAGHSVTGVYLECWRAPGCRAEEDRKDALHVALDLDIPFRVLDFKEAYRNQVVERFFRDYENGFTPNPDIWCNTEIKFGLFYDWAMQQGFDAIATGHYAQIVENSGRKRLARSADEKKDQTYFLYRTEQEQLDHVLFPIGHLQKQQVREEAKRRSLFVANKPDSQGICFIGDIDVQEFLKERFGEKAGAVLDGEGNVIGEHRGHWFYTIGQRHGFVLNKKVYTKRQEWRHVLPPLYVVAKDAVANTITVGFGVETECWSAGLTEVFWRTPADFPADSTEVEVMYRLRHGGALQPGRLRSAHGAVTLHFSAAQKGVAPGQSVVFYDSTHAQICWGGGVIGNRDRPS